MPLVRQALAGVNGPIVAVTDYMRAVPDQVVRWIDQPYRSLGTDGFGRSDTREALRRFFEIDGPHIAVATLAGLVDQGVMEAAVVADAIQRYELEPDAPDPWTI